MALVASKMDSTFQLSRLTNQKRDNYDKDAEPPRKKQKTNSEYRFSLTDLNRQLYTREEIKTYTFDDKPSPSEKKEICFWCDAITEQDSFKCPYHGDKNIEDKPVKPTKPELPYAYQSVPDEVRLCKSSIPGAGYGIQSNTSIPAGAWIGPYEGKIVKVEDAPKQKSTYMWEIFEDGKLHAYIDGSDENTASWMRFIRCARHPAEQNLFAFQYLGKIYYRAYKSIPRGEELLVWYDDKYTQYMGIPFSPMDTVAVTTTDGKLIRLLQDVRNQKTPETIPGAETPPPTPTKKQHFEGFPTTSRSVRAAHNMKMQTSFQKIGALQETANAVKRSNGFQSSENFKPVVTTPTNSAMVSPVRPSPKHSHGFVLKISDGNVTCSTQNSDGDGEKEGLLPPSPSSSSSPTISPTSPNTKECFKFESQSTAEARTERHEAVETSLWRCGQCTKSFAQRAMLQIHVCARIPNKPYQCGHCFECFGMPSELRAHAVVHQGRKPFKCGYCSRAFSGATTLNNHIRTHTGEKPFVCDKCGKTFTQGSQLSRHQKIPGDCVPKSCAN